MIPRIHIPSAIAGALVVALTFTTLSMRQALTATQIYTLTPQQHEILTHMSIVQLPDGQGGTSKTIRISDVNVQLVNGLGATATKNGLGNLIVGYCEGGLPTGDDRTGSHNLVGGIMNSFSNWGGFVVGRANTVAGPWATVTGGAANLAANPDCSVSGGYLNTVTANYGWAAGGGQNTVLGDYGSACGGSLNTVGGINALAAGGAQNSSVGDATTTTGGEANSASGIRSSVSGGHARAASGTHDWAAGSLFEDN